MDFIQIEDLEVYAGHGVLEEENRNGQLFLISARLYTGLREAGKTDELTSSTHYGEVCHFIHTYMREHTFRLIEAAAENLVREILLAFPLIEKISMELKKPEAPIGLPFKSVSVNIERGWSRVYLGIGSNMGEKQAYIDGALKGLLEKREIRNVRCSKLLVTKPYGGVRQDDFLNGAVELDTLLPPYELLDFLHELEQRAGRERKLHWGPRTLDLDILFYEGFVSDEPALTVPHQDMENRLFVLEPLAELCPYYINPVNQKSVRQMYRELMKKEEKES